MGQGGTCMPVGFQNPRLGLVLPTFPGAETAADFEETIVSLSFSLSSGFSYSQTSEDRMQSRPTDH